MNIFYSVKAMYTALDLLDASVQRNPHGIAAEDADQQVTWEQLNARADQVGARLLTAGVAVGDRVALLLNNDVNHVVAMLGVWKVGGVFVNVNPKLKSRQVDHILSDCTPAAIVTTPARTELVAGHEALVLSVDDLSNTATVDATWPRVIDRDLACLIYTSGSTGHPKGVMFRQGDIVMCARIMAEAFDWQADERVLNTLAFSADHGLTLLYLTLLKGGAIVLSQAFLPQDIANELAAKKITAFSGVAPIWSAFYGSRSDFKDRQFPHLRHLSIGGGRPPERVLQAVKEQFKDQVNVFLLYGLTEANWTSYVAPEHLEAHLDSIGQPLPNVDVMVVDANDQPCEPGQEGELIHRGGVVAAGYWQNPEKTAETFRERNGERVVYSGDIVKQDEAGWLYYLGRRDHQIKVQGYRIATEDIIDCLHETGLIDEVGLFAVPDDASGERVIVCVTPKTGAIEVQQQVLKHLKTELPSYMVPSELIVLDQLPYTHSGKVNTTLLKEQYQAGEFTTVPRR